MSDFIRIPLTKGREAIIDAEDYAIVMGAARSWHACPQGKNHYAQARALVTHQVLMMHRVIMHAPKGLVVDHINHDTLDNRKTNLRIVTRQQNQCNVLPRQGNHSRFKGVCLNKRVNLWVAYINAHGKRTYLGYYHHEEDAARAYDAASLSLHGEYGHRNFA
ncbi:HNH endonuclease [Rhizobium sp. BK456]|uniref:HNH endonuclease n=1 Tax=Rhizobium sp. BK456 TaxID=2587007 RepID=UPI001619B1CE|nr:HNH endonuclease [Rhizobium sp. BK456]MBB3521048.1 hypothetical protein [Rhizobium sp. BK456]